MTCFAISSPLVGLRFPDQWGDIWEVTACYAPVNYRDGKMHFEVHRLIDPAKHASAWSNQDACIKAYSEHLEEWAKSGCLNTYGECLRSSLFHDNMEPCVPVTAKLKEVQPCNPKPKEVWCVELTGGDFEFFVPVSYIYARMNHKLYPMELEEAITHSFYSFTGRIPENAEITGWDYDGYASRFTDSRGRAWE